MIQFNVERSARDYRKILAAGFALAALLAMSMTLATKPAHADTTFIVTSTADPGNGVCDVVCTMREAISAANDTPGKDAIHFRLSNTGEVRTITPTSALPAITEAVTIDGYSQLGSSPNTLPKGTDARLLIELDGSNSEEDSTGIKADGLTILAGDVVVRGLVINRFGDDGIDTFDAAGARIEGNFIGTDASGTRDLGNGAAGVFVFSGSSHKIGGAAPEARNIISGNEGDGVEVSGNTKGTKVEGNLIGTKKDGRSRLGNNKTGVDVSNSSGNFVGGISPGAANTIAFNRNGVEVSDDGSIGNRILGNPIFSNAGLGIDLIGGTENADFVTANDPNDPDTGPNNLQNFPTLNAAANTGGVTTVRGSLDSTPNQTFTVQFFSNPAPNVPTGFGEGETFLGQTSVTTNASGDASFSFTPNPAVPTGHLIAATATKNSTGDTSEFSGARSVVNNTPPVADDDSFAVNEDATLSVPAPGVLGGDTDSGTGGFAEPLTVSDADPSRPGVQPTTNTRNGTLTLRADGAVTYKPRANFFGTDSFTYRAADATSESNLATVTITVRPVNDAPTITSLSPRPNSRTRDSTPTIRAVVRDIETNLSKPNVKLFVDGKRKSTFTYNRSTDQLAFISGRLSLGKHTVKVVATDAQKKSVTKGWTFRVIR